MRMKIYYKNSLMADTFELDHPVISESRAACPVY